MFTQATTAFSVVGGFGAIAAEWNLSTTRSAMLLTAFGVTFAVSAPDDGTGNERPRLRPCPGILRGYSSDWAGLA